jgi:hypothetical protein
MLLIAKPNPLVRYHGCFAHAFDRHTHRSGTIL